MHKLVWVSGFLMVFGVGCGGSTSAQGTGGSAGSAATGGTGASSGSGGSGAVGGGGATGGSGGTAGSGATGGVGGSGGVPNECAVPAPGPGPYAVKIRFKNSAPTPLFIRQDCVLNWSLYACSDGYTTALSKAADCMASCADPSGGGCIACGACMMDGLEVTSAKPLETDWSGITYSFSQNSNGCQCYDEHPAPASKYQIRVPVYMTQADAQAGNQAYEAVGAFDLPSASVVEIELAATM